MRGEGTYEYQGIEARANWSVLQMMVGSTWKVMGVSVTLRHSISQKPSCSAA